MMQASLLASSQYLHAVTDAEGLPDLGATLGELCRKRFRRIDRFVQLALLGSARCARACTLSPACGLYIGSSYGPLTSNIRVQKKMFGELELPKPFDFVNTLGSSAGFYVADNLELTGPAVFLTRYERSLEAALDVAMTDLAVGAVEQALVGLVEEAPLPVAQHRRRLGADAGTDVAEASHWLLLGRGDGGPLLGFEPYRDATDLERRLDGLASAAGGVCLGPGLDAAATQAVRRRFPDAVDRAGIALPYHAGLEGAWFVTHAGGAAGATLLVSGDADGGGALLHLGA